LFLESSEPWTIYVGQPARAIRERSQALLDLERRYLADEGD
jgi:galactoside O-acetyltransferase